MDLRVPSLSLVVLVGPPGVGKTTFARKHFRPTEVLTADHFRAMLSDSEDNQYVTEDAFRILSEVARVRLRRGLLTVVDACSLGEGDRKHLLEMARQSFVKAVAVVLAAPARTCVQRAGQRADRPLPEDVVRKCHQRFVQEALPKVPREKWDRVYVLDTPELAEKAQLVREPLRTRAHELAGPFDFIGDVHGCYDELVLLIAKLGYVLDPDPEGPFARHPEGRKLVFLGDLVDRGPRTPDVLRLVMGSVRRGTALCVLGNHDEKCARALDGKKVKVHEGLRRSLVQLGAQSGAFRQQVQDFVAALPSHLVLDGKRLLAVHAGLPREMHGRDTDDVTQICKYGMSTGEHDASGHPVRLHWENDYRGETLVVFGHIVEREVRQVNNTVCIDTGCVFGGRLTALRYPERQIVDVQAHKIYIEPDFDGWG